MATRCEEQEIGELRPVGEPCRQGMAFEVVDSGKWLVRDQRQGLSGRDPDENAADEARPCGRRDAVQIGEPYAGSIERARYQSIYHLHVGARGDLRNDPAISSVLGDLTKDFIGQNSASPVGAELDNGSRRLVAGGLDAKNAHIGDQVGRMTTDG
jgi:hypothetical protein